MSLNYFFDTQRGKDIQMRIGALEMETDSFKSNTIETELLKLGNINMEGFEGLEGSVMTCDGMGNASFQLLPPPPPPPPGNRGNETLVQCVETTSIIFPNGMVETDFFSLGSPVDTALLKDGSKLICSFSGALSSGGVGAWELTLRLYVCNIAVGYVVTLPIASFVGEQFRAKIEVTIRTAGATGSTYAIGDAEFTTGGGNYVKDIQQIGFGTIDTTSTLYNLKATGQFNASPTGLSINNRGGEIVLHNTIE